MRMIFDSDMITEASAKRAILTKILNGKKPIAKVVHGPAGSGKTTLVASTGEFIRSEKDLRKATEFVVISGAGKTKSGGPSANVEKLMKKAEKISFVIVPNDEIKKRRLNRIENGVLDARDAKQLRGTLRAPLNQFDFIAKLRKIAKASEIVKA
jgi:energy-coupling factor transporter ATP-binding protein EcfA2